MLRRASGCGGNPACVVLIISGFLLLLFVVAVQLLHKKTLSLATGKLPLSRFLKMEGTFVKSLIVQARDLRPREVKGDTSVT